MIAQTIDLDAPVSLKVYRHQVTLVNCRTEEEVSFTVATLSDRFSEVLKAIRTERAAMGLKGCYEIFECLPLN